MGRINKVLLVVGAQRRAEKKYLQGAESIFSETIAHGMRSNGENLTLGARP